MQGGVIGTVQSPDRLFGFTYGLTLALALICLLAGSPALADGECTPNPPPSGGGTINCSGTFTSGIDYDLDDGDWTINLENDIDIDTTGYDDGLRVEYDGEDSLTINMLGGSITTEGTGADANGIYVEHSGSEGNININVSSAADIETKGLDADGIYVECSGSGNIDIEVSADIKTAKMLSRGIHVDHSGSGNIDIDLLDGVNIESKKAHAVYAVHDSTGGVTIAVGGQLVSGEDALVISNSSTSPATITLESATIQAGTDDKAIVTDSSNDSLKITSGLNQITGDIDLGTGMDTMTFQVADGGNARFTLMGVITGLENISKTGAGAALLSDISSSGSDMDLEEGDLYLNGHLDIGSGEFTIQDTSRLIFGTDGDDHGRITASHVKFSASDWQKLYVADRSRTAINGRDVLVNGDGSFQDNNGDTVEPKLYNEDEEEVGSITENGIVSAAPDPDPDPDPDPSSTGSGGCSIGGGDSGNTSNATVGLLLFLCGLLLFLETGRKTKKKLKRVAVS